MVKLTNDQKDEIICLKLKGEKAKEIMNKFNISRPYIYKLLKDYNIEYMSEVNSNVDITEIEGDIFESLNDEKNDILVDDNNTELNINNTELNLNNTEIDKKPYNNTELNINNTKIEQIPISNINLHSATRIINTVTPDKLNSLRMFLDEPQHNKPQNIQNIKVETDLTLSDEYPEIQNTMNIIKRYIDTYYDSGKLDDIVGSDKRTFVLRLNELNLYQLKILLSNLQFKLSSSNTSKLFESGFYLMASQVESTSCYFNYDISGLTQALRHNQEIGDCLKEMACKYDVTKYVSPESRMIMAVPMTAYSVYNNNNMRVKFDSFLSSPVSDNLKDNYKNL